MKFENRFVAFLDVLGYKDLLQKTDFENKLSIIHSSIQRSIRSAKDKRRLHSKVAKKEMHHLNAPSDTLQITTASDSIILSIKCDDTNQYIRKIINFRYLIYVCALIQKTCAERGIWLRGGISYGRTTHSNRLVAGKGVSAAWEAEQKANFPRILLHEDLKIPFQGSSVKNLKKLSSLLNQYPYNKKDNYILRQQDGSEYAYFVDCLHFGTKSQISQIFQKSVQNVSQNSKIKEKHKWVQCWLKQVTHLDEKPHLPPCDIDPVKCPRLSKIDMTKDDWINL